MSDGLYKIGGKCSVKIVINIALERRRPTLCKDDDSLGGVRCGVASLRNPAHGGGGRDNMAKI